MARRRIGAGGPFLVAPEIGNFTTTVKKLPVVVVSVQANIRSTLKYRLKTEIQLGKVFGKKSIFPAPIWVTNVVKKRASLNRRLISRQALGEPIVTIVTAVITKVKPIKIVSFVSKQRKSFKGTISLRKPTKTIVVVVQGTKRQLRILLNKVVRKQQKTQFKFTKVFGRPTRSTVPQRARYLKFVAQQAERRSRYVPVKIRLGKVPRLFTPTPPPPTTGRTSGMLAAKHVRRLIRKW